MSEEEYKKIVLERIKEEMKKHYSESAWDLAHMVMGQDLIKIVIDETINVLNSRGLITWRKE